MDLRAQQVQHAQQAQPGAPATGSDWPQPDPAANAAQAATWAEGQPVAGVPAPAGGTTAKCEHGPSSSAEAPAPAPAGPAGCARAPWRAGGAASWEVLLMVGSQVAAEARRAVKVGRGAH